MKGKIEIGWLIVISLLLYIAYAVSPLAKNPISEIASAIKDEQAVSANLTANIERLERQLADANESNRKLSQRNIKLETENAILLMRK